MTAKVLTIAGSDPSGGAGIQADLKTFSALGAYGMAVLSALTAQNTVGVQGIHDVPPEFVALQARSVLTDIPPDAIKTGMLSNAAVVRAVAQALRENAPGIPLVVDPVMVAKSGDRLLREDAVRAVIEALLPLAAIVTPNAEEAALLAGMPPLRNRDEMEQAAAAILRLGPKAVLVKGGHSASPDRCDDLYASGDGSRAWLEGERLSQRHTHGTGCTLSAAIATFLGQGLTPYEACREGKRFITEAIAHAFPLGHGTGPVNHLWKAGRDDS